jgi:hypothetical protein
MSPSKRANARPAKGRAKATPRTSSKTKPAARAKARSKPAAKPAPKAPRPAAKKAPVAAKKKTEVNQQIPSKEKSKAKGPAPKVSKPAAPKKRPAAAKGRPSVSDIAQGPPKPGLGLKWSCFSCGAKFYDLGKPDPVCPKCGSDQRDRPLVSDKPAPTPAPKRATLQPMARYLDDDEVVNTSEETYAEEGEDEPVEIDIDDLEEGSTGFLESSGGPAAPGEFGDEEE